MKTTLNLLTTGLLTLSLFSQPLLACINTSYSRADEVEITDELLPLILGAFPHHGKAFYEQEVIRTQKILFENPGDFDARNDLGAAYTKLQLWDNALDEFEKNENTHPNRYETASNLGVMFKKKGDYEQAEKYISKALDIKPGGHMGLGDYYLKMIQWLGTHGEQRKNNEWETNFLGVPYVQGPEATAQVANEDHIVTLIKNDYQFIDAYTVLGDILFTKGDYQLALRSYYRALNLAQQAQTFSPTYDTSIPYERIRKISEIWQKQKTSEYVLERDNGDEQISQEILYAAQWLEEFQEIEAEYIAGNKAATFHSLLTELNARSIREPIVLEAGFYKGTEVGGGGDYFASDLMSVISSSIILLTLLLVLICLIWAIWRFYTRQRA